MWIMLKFVLLKYIIKNDNLNIIKKWWVSTISEKRKKWWTSTIKWRTKKQLDYIKVKVAVNDYEEIKFHKAINPKGAEEIERDISSYIAN